MLFCRILLGKERKTDREEGDHIYVSQNKYYVINNGDQVLPLFLIKFKNNHDPYYSKPPKSSKKTEGRVQQDLDLRMARASKKPYSTKKCSKCERALLQAHYERSDWQLDSRVCKVCQLYNSEVEIEDEDILSPYLRNKAHEVESDLRIIQTGAKEPGRFHRKCNMVADSTDKIWVGYLDPMKSNTDLINDVIEFLHDVPLLQETIKIEQEGLRRAARLTLASPISKVKVLELNERLYLGKYQIAIDDRQPNNPANRGMICKRLAGPNKYCRSANLRYVDDPCDFLHPPEKDPTFRANYTFEEITFGSAIFDQIKGQLASVTNNILSIRRIRNPVLNERFEARKKFQNLKHGTDGGERELWHGTNCNTLSYIYKNGLRCPSDYEPSPNCPFSGGKGLCTSLCSNDCPHCVTPHTWKRCHMYGLGIYLADIPEKSHRYVTCPIVVDPNPPRGKDGTVYKLIRCRVHLGNPYLIEGHLKSQDAMHDNYVPFSLDEDKFEFLVKPEECPTGSDSYFVRGLGSRCRPGSSVINSEYICFTPWQVLPLYEISYTLSPPSNKVLEHIEHERNEIQSVGYC
eukprot:NODE_1312_length_2014_cov_49.300899_g1109_i0.p1 GENE.NODE_1312_length_2014_cov_49.300899_g1109_i0~~NODE_1312_length_2014_cov_49.300899_g1109_i0.p1  ORF type:complete len:601 (+),score=94.32 NODE_1312_length_2014_cov_49.300899_g1109_i0:83-1804(+)